MALSISSKSGKSYTVWFNFVLFHQSDEEDVTEEEDKKEEETVEEISNEETIVDDDEEFGKWDDKQVY
ncbi:hypothetical protein TVAG_345220 [Trichomonas vaginalis G3]|uniref:Uncharacterized protein n=1 Tax=Trichomonas vaginalis (strain ATCC PRA-98 / G3) TaxID=412133 RepID=A2EW00_TRIV3|nr:hypothetical protein TVAGG3_0120320 [Trichomonas vaginalis G3]EAY03148.1 hypothetical protein TVAG_345220 [Trichomonas vaginalis G3]KAI5545434.1 hypothetical protein TVAGG3_0120320 [Trichomonas vaginalis G3]|eukprot:XP_001315371.1 hypothetical protein [Trichomonas vaginalis G3]